MAGGSSVRADEGVQEGVRVGGGDGVGDREGHESQCPSASPAGFALSSGQRKTPESFHTGTTDAEVISLLEEGLVVARQTLVSN